MDVSNIAFCMIGFYLLIAANYLKELFGCHLQLVLENMIAKHVLGFILLVFLVIITNPANAGLSIDQIAYISVAVYIWFLISTRTHYLFCLTSLILLMGVYVINMNKDKVEAEKRHQLENAQTVLLVVAVIINLIGFGIYLIEKINEYGSEFRIMHFFEGTTVCRHYTPQSAKIL